MTARPSMAPSYGRDKFFAWRYEVWGAPDEWRVCEHPAGSERRIVSPRRFKTFLAADAEARRMNAEWDRYQVAMLANRASWPRSNGDSS